jgi:exodeoxyribonuclease-5
MPLESTSLTLCATSRLAQTLRRARPGAQAVWRTPQAMTPAQWLAALADDALLCGIDDLPQALDPVAERLLWEQVIAADLGDASPLFDLGGMAATAAEAHALCRVWALQPTGEFLPDETRRFLAWQAAFLKCCTAQGWIDLAGLHQRLLGLIESGQFALPAKVHLAGFDRLTPFEQHLCAALRARGVTVTGDEIEAAATVDRRAAQVFAGPDAEAECAAAVAWAAEQLAARPDARLGIVAPDLAGVRALLETRLDAAFHPDLLRPDAAEVPRCFNFSLGHPLADLPLVRTALDLLRLGSLRGKVEQARFSALLLAGGWSASVSEADGRALFDAAMRQGLHYFVSLPGLLRFAERLAEQGELACPQSVAALKAVAEVFATAPRSARAGAWAGYFRTALRAAAWPGERPLSSHDYQAHRAFGEVLDAFAALDPVLGKLSLAEALKRFAALCRERVFQAETRGTPSIQVLGVLESAGLEFDALWVMGLNDDRWPPAPRPNPLLPAELQRQAGSAHASAAVELDFARRVQDRLLASAPVVTLSWSRADGNRLLRPSPLLVEQPPAVDLPGVRKIAALAEDACECLMDTQAPPVGEGEKVPGGSWILRAQAICPAWAFFQHRLGAAALETPVEGLDAADRGTLVHAVLEGFWMRWRDQAAVQALDAPGLTAAIAEAVDTALTAFETNRRLPLPPRFRGLEAARLQRLVERWLAVDLARSLPFEVIACEQRAELSIEGIRVRMTVDRIDRLADGRRIIVDYKTGQRIDVANWAADRITEPQLPIYAALVESEIAGVVFAKVLLDKPAFSGVADAPELLPGVSGIGDEKQKLFDPARFPDWPSVLAHWRTALTAIAHEIRAGEAGVRIADEAALAYCEVLPCLRLPEWRRWQAESGSMA